MQAFASRAYLLSTLFCVLFSAAALAVDSDGDGVPDDADSFPLDATRSAGNFGVLYNFTGDSAYDWFGISVSGAGDVNNDGFADVIVGTRYDDNNGTDAGSARVFSGANGSILYTFNGDNASDEFGISVSGAGDVNNDGYADVIVGASKDDNRGYNSGSARVLSGANGSILYTFNGNSENDYFGQSVSGAGDVNNDGYADVIVGDNNIGTGGRARVLSGANGSILYTFNGYGGGNYFGYSVSGAGDVNNDGYADVIVGAYGDDNKGTDSGSARVFSGANGSILYTFDGDSADDRFGYSVSGAGDVNNDGYADVIVGAYRDDNNGTDSGSARVLSGANGSILYTFNGDSANDNFGCSVSAAGDVNNDGYADVTVGAYLDDNNGGNSGSARIFSGANGSILYTFNGDSAGDYFGFSVSGAGDVNNDGYTDVIVGGHLNDNNGTESGSARILSGKAHWTDIDGDGVMDDVDADNDNDGVVDASDRFPLDPTESADNDNDGIGNNADTDDDNDAVVDISDNCPSNANANQLNTDGDAQGNVCDGDDDNDGVADASDRFPLDPTESADNDNDGTGNNADTDDDNDSVPDVLDNCPFYSSSDQLNTDGDAQGNACDSDDDNDGVIDTSDKFPLNLAASSDADNDGFPSSWNVTCDATCQGNSGLVLDNCPSNANAEQLNTDGDVQGNVCDTDDDNDGVPDTTDSFAQDATRSAGNFGVLHNFNGDSADDRFGISVSAAGDVNNDGYADVIVGAYGDNNNGSDSGSARVLSGANGSILYTFNGDSAGDYFGISVSAAGDVNNDGYADVIVGAYGDDNNGTDSGSARVFSGANGSILYTFDGDSTNDNFGISVSAAGDVNNDGYADVIVGAYLDDNNGTDSGSARVLSGANGSILYTFNGDSANDRFGVSVSGAGDVNNDGYADVIVGAHQDDNNGIDSGSARIFSGANGSILYTFNGDSAGDYFGFSVSATGDVNNDGYADVIVGARQDDNNGTDSGSARVLSGANGSILYTFNGDSANDNFGCSVSAAGDVNNDGYDDVIVAAYGDDNRGSASGSARILSGKAHWTDIDGDGAMDAVDADNDNDGVPDINDAFPRNAAESIDTDNDGIGNNADADDDGDGVADTSDKFPLNLAASSDSDNDGFPGNWNAVCDTTCQGNSGLVLDNCPSNINVDQLDSDSDGIGNVCDNDNDNDSVPDNVDPAPTNGLITGYQPPWFYTFNGDSANDRFGASVSGAGDVNNDGYADVIIGASYDDNNGTDSGSARVLSGANGNILYTFNGDSANDKFGVSVSGAGDVNNDGYADVIVGAHQDDNKGTDSGSARVLSGANGSILYTFNGDSVSDYFGFSVSAAGDVNNDGYADVIVGAYGDDNNGTDSGSARVLSGANGSILYTFNGDSAGDYFGFSVSAAGDVNNDGYADVIVGAYRDDNNGTDSGSARIFSGANGSILYTFNGDSANDNFGISVSAAGDVNNDGYADVIVGAYGDDNNGTDSGSARVLSGANGSILYTFNGDSANDRFGVSVSGAGDVNNDGYADVIVGAHQDDNNGTDSGSARVLSGANGSILYTFNGDSVSDYFGYSVSAAGDVNNDGYADVIVGAYGDDNNGNLSGSARVLSGALFLQQTMDTDTDGQVNTLDMDDDNDGVPDINDAFPQDTDNDGLNNNADTDDDNDGMPDVWEVQYGFNPLVNDASGDLDGDGLTNLQEYSNGSNPTIAVTVKNDYNRDGIAGWIWQGVSNGNETQSQIWQLTLPLQSPNYTAPARSYPPTFGDQANWDIVTSGDFDKDGDADIVWRHKTTDAWKIWQMQDGLRVAQTNWNDAFDPSHEWQVIGAGDTDKDGDDDIILNNTITGAVMVWEMQSYVVAATHNLGTKAGYTLNRIGDFNKDGDVDLLFRQNGGDALITWEIESNAFVTERALASTGTDYSPVCAGDFDNDGDDDIMLVNSSTKQEKWFVMESYTRTQQFGGINDGFVLLGCGDYDGDGDADSLWQRSADDMNRVVLQQNWGATKQTIYTNAFGGANGFVHRGNSN